MDDFKTPEEPTTITHDIFPYLRQYKDGTIHRLAGTDFIPPGLDSNTNVISYDVNFISPPIINPNHNLNNDDTPHPHSISARIYHPPTVTTSTNHQLPLVIYLHGGAFLVANSGEPRYHQFLNTLSVSANVIILSVNYRLAPEHPLPAAFDDGWDTIQWLAAQSKKKRERDTDDGGSDTIDELVNGRIVDFSRVYIVGDSSGATMGHYIGCQMGMETDVGCIKLKGIVHIHPYFWGKVRIGYENMDDRREMVDIWWEYVCPSEKGCDDPLINPFVDGAPKMEKLKGVKLMVCVAEKDVLRDRGIAYYQGLMKKGITAELFETKGEDHVFHIFNLNGVKAVQLMGRIVEFINQE